MRSSSFPEMLTLFEMHLQKVSGSYAAAKEKQGDGTECVICRLAAEKV